MWYTKIWESHSRVVNTLDLWSIYNSNIIGRNNDDRDSCGTARTGRLHTSSNDQVRDSNHSYYYPDINISLTLDVTTPGRFFCFEQLRTAILSSQILSPIPRTQASCGTSAPDPLHSRLDQYLRTPPKAQYSI